MDNEKGRDPTPKFTVSQKPFSGSLWENLKSFLTERPIEVRPGSQANTVLKTHGDFETTFVGNLKEFLSGPKFPKNSGSGPKALQVNCDANFGSFSEKCKGFFLPEKPVPLPPGIEPVQTKEIWTKPTRKEHLIQHFGGMGVAGIFMLLITLTLALHATKKVESVPKNNVMRLDTDSLSPYAAKLPVKKDKAGGGGGANDHTNTPVNKGRPPRFTATQFAAPTLHPNPQPKLPMEATLLGPPDLKIAANLTNLGDPLATGPGDSLGHGNGTGIGSGTGAGLGLGEGGGTGGGAFRAGVGGIGMPSCYYTPNPPYSDEARKAKYSGVVLVEATVTEEGKVTNPRVIKSPGLGLDESTVKTLRTWRCKPVIGPNGKPIPVSLPFEVTFRLY